MPYQAIPGWRLWVSSTGRWWALRQTALTASQVAAGCEPLIYAADSLALAAPGGTRYPYPAQEMIWLTVAQDVPEVTQELCLPDRVR